MNEETIVILNSLSWPGAFVIAGVALAFAWIFSTIFKDF